MAVSAAMSGLALASVPLWEDSCNGSAPFLQKQDLPAEIKMKFQPHEILESGFLSKENFQVVPYDIDTLLLNASNVDQSFGLAKFVSEHNKIRLNHLKADTLEADSATKVKIVKNKVAPPFKEAEFDIMFGEGISKAGEIVDLGAELNIIKKSGSWYSYNDTKLGQGRDAAKQCISDNPELAEELSGLIFEALKG